jgi:DNA (cytosine-5)-methyltransferase 1
MQIKVKITVAPLWVGVVSFFQADGMTSDAEQNGAFMNEHKFPYEWTLKDAVFTKDKGKVFSCFACGGGSTMGYKLAGFDVIGCNEIDPKMMEAYRANHNPKYSYLEPIQTFKLRDDLPDELYDLDILDGSPPCSSFSMAGNREKDWGKDKKFREGQAEQVLDTLFFDFIDLAKKLQPKVVIAENVKGLLLGDAQKYVDRILTAFDDAGYWVDFKLLDASKMGVPQRRERVFFYAVRKDLYKGQFVDLFGTRPALDLRFDEEDIIFSDVYEKADRKGISDSIVKAYEYCMEKAVADFAQYYEVNFNKRKYFNTRLIFKNRVCDTIKSDCTHVIEGESGYISDIELKKCGSYPLDYNFVGNKTDYLVGMSVPPVMTAQIATRVFEQWIKPIQGEINENQKAI